MTRSLLSDLQAQAQRLSRRADEAEDLLQTALLAAVEAGRTDFSAPDTRRWLFGVMRNQARMSARTAVRRRRREAAWKQDDSREAMAAFPALDLEALLGLPKALRLTALLAVNGCTREEIRWLLGINDATLRQRLTQLRRALARLDLGENPPSALPGETLALGRIRQALLPQMRRRGVLFASHDPDGNLFLISRSQTGPVRQLSDG